MEETNSLPKVRIIIIGIFILVAIGALILLFLLRKNSSSQPPTITPTEVPLYPTAGTTLPKPTFKKAEGAIINPAVPISFDLPQNTTLPTKASKISISHALSSTTINLLTSSFSFQAQPKELGTSLLWTKENDTESLLVAPNSGFIQYSNSKPIVENPTRLSLPELESVANELIKKLKITNITSAPTDTKGYINGGEDQLPQETIENATTYELSYQQAINGIPLYYQLGSPARVSVWIDVYGTVRKIEYFNLQLTEIAQFPVITLEEVKKRTSEGNAVIVKLGDFEDAGDLVQSITITNVSAAYFDDKTGAYLSPIFVLSGRATIPSGTVEIILYLSAT